MLTLTEEACARLADKLARKRAGEATALRFVRRERRKGWTLLFDSPGTSDTTFSHHGRIVLVLDEQASKSLRDKMLDVRETKEGPRLRLLGV